ncbi:MAG: AAA family ATPase [Muribaculaceae bacterium]|nr:AAA family ATPase [Muribaculaceae bacterium]
MENFRLENYRCFSDTGTLDIKPINLLIGRNSSGKSSLLKFFPLLKQSMRRHINGVFLWYDESLVDFKDFNNALKRGAHEMVITLTNDVYSQGQVFKHNSSLPVRVTTKLTLAPLYSLEAVHADSIVPDYLKKISIEFLGNNIELALSNDAIPSTKIIDLTINGERINLDEKEYIVAQDIYLPNIIFLDDINEELGKDEQKDFQPKSTLGKLRQLLIELNPSEVKLSTHLLIYSFSLYSLDQFRDILGVRSESPKIELVKKAHTLYLLHHLDHLFGRVRQQLAEQSQYIYYIEPLRSVAQRFYRYQNLTVEQLNPDGSNLPMYLFNLNLYERDRLNKWLSEHFNFEFEVVSSGGHFEILIKESGKKKANLVDVGFGYSQLLPIIVQIWGAIHRRSTSYMDPSFKESLKFPRIIAIEQPELHLHPRMIGKFARMLGTIIGFCKTHGLDVRFIIETHSKTLLERLGTMIADSSYTEGKEDTQIAELTKDDAQVLLFNNGANEEENYIVKSAFDDDGFLTEWPVGFLDEDMDE